MKKILYCGVFSIIAFNVCEANQAPLFPPQIKGQINFSNYNAKGQAPGSRGGNYVAPFLAFGSSKFVPPKHVFREPGNSSASQSPKSSFGLNTPGGRGLGVPVLQAQRFTPPPPPVPGNGGSSYVASQLPKSSFGMNTPGGGGLGVPVLQAQRFTPPPPPAPGNGGSSYVASQSPKSSFGLNTPGGRGLGVPVPQSQGSSLPPPPKSINPVVFDKNGETALILGSASEKEFSEFGRKLGLNPWGETNEIRLKGPELTDKKVKVLLDELNANGRHSYITKLVFEGETKISDEWLRRRTAEIGKEDYGQLKRENFTIKNLMGDESFVNCSKIRPPMWVKFSNEQLGYLVYNTAQTELKSLFMFKKQTGKGEIVVDVRINGDLLEEENLKDIGHCIGLGCRNKCFNFYLSGFDDKKLFCFARALWIWGPQPTIGVLDLSESSNTITSGGITAIEGIFTRAKINVKNLICEQRSERPEPLMVVRDRRYGGDRVDIFDANIDFLEQAILPPLPYEVFRGDTISNKTYSEALDVLAPYSELRIKVNGAEKDVGFFGQIGRGIVPLFSLSGEIGYILHAKGSKRGKRKISVDLSNNGIDGERLNSFIDPIVKTFAKIRGGVIIEELNLGGNPLREEDVRNMLEKCERAGVKILNLKIDWDPRWSDIKPIVEIDKDSDKSWMPSGRERIEFYKENIGSLESCMTRTSETRSVVLRVNNCSEDLEVYRQFGRAIGSYVEKISDMDFSDKGLGGEKICHFLSGVFSRCGMPRLNKLELKGKNMGADSLMKILDLCRLKVCTDQLNVDNNPGIGTAGGIILLRESGRKSAFWKEVSHAGCGIDDDTLNRLKSMNYDTVFSDKKFGAQGKKLGAEAVSDLKGNIDNLSSHEPTVNLDLACRVISDADVPQLIELLESLKAKGVRYVTVNLEGNFLTDFGVSSIVQKKGVFDTSEYLVEIIIDDNCVSKEVASWVDDINRQTRACNEERKKLAHDVDEYDKKEREIQILQDRIEETQGTLDFWERFNLSEKREKIETIRKALVDQEENSIKLENELSSAQSSIDELRKSIVIILDDRGNSIAKLELFASYQEEIRSNNEYIKTCQQEIKELNKQLDEIKRLKSSFVGLEDKESESDKKAEKTVEEMETEITTEIRKLESNMQRAMEDEEEIEEIEKKTEEEIKKEIEDEIEERRQAVTSFRNANNSLKAEIAKLLKTESATN